MKKSQLRNIIRKSIKELMNEQLTPQCMRLVFEQCSSGPHQGPVGAQSICPCCFVDGATPTQADIGKIVRNTLNASPWNFSYVNIITDVIPNYSTIPSANHNMVTQGANCEGVGTAASSCNPSAWSNHSNWTTTFTNTVANHNNPCNFLNQKIAQFTSNLQGTGQGNYQNVQNCKLDLANQLHTQNNC